MSGAHEERHSAKQQEDEGWQKVERRRARSEKNKEGERCVTFFFRNFPDWSTVGDLRQRFEEVGRVKDIFVPGKKDKLGNRFGFVRFKGEGEEEQILNSLNTIWIGTYIIRAFQPKYDRPLKRNGKEESRRADNRSEEVLQKQKEEKGGLRKGGLFSESMGGRGERGGKKRKSGGQISHVPNPR